LLVILQAAAERFGEEKGRARARKSKVAGARRRSDHGFSDAGSAAYLFGFALTTCG